MYGMDPGRRRLNAIASAHRRMHGQAKRPGLRAPGMWERDHMTQVNTFPEAITTLTKRADFLAANKGLRNARPGFVLLTRPNGGAGMRYGITVTKKIGNAVVRNRMKRRFRELLRAALPERGLPDHDHVLIGRAGGVERDFAQMAKELDHVLAQAREGKCDPARRPRRGNRKASPTDKKREVKRTK